MECTPRLSLPYTHKTPAAAKSRSQSTSRLGTNHDHTQNQDHKHNYNHDHDQNPAKRTIEKTRIQIRKTKSTRLIPQSLCKNQVIRVHQANPLCWQGKALSKERGFFRSCHDAAPRQLLVVSKERGDPDDERRVYQLRGQSFLRDVGGPLAGRKYNKRRGDSAGSAEKERKKRENGDKVGREE